MQRVFESDCNRPSVSRQRANQQFIGEIPRNRTQTKKKKQIH